jgi:large subunit ribosomal protein L10
MPTQRKVEQVEKIKQLVEASGAVYFADLSRLTAKDMSDVRRKFRKDSIRLVVAKNRLAQRALTEAGVSADLAAIMRGPTSLVIGTAQEPYAAARLLRDLGLRFKEWKFKGAYVEKALFTAEQFDAVASMPTRPELHGQLVGVLLSPLTQLAMVLEGLLSGLVMTLDEVKKQRETAAPEATAAPTESA